MTKVTISHPESKQICQVQDFQVASWSTRGWIEGDLATVEAASETEAKAKAAADAKAETEAKAKAAADAKAETEAKAKAAADAKAAAKAATQS